VVVVGEDEAGGGRGVRGIGLLFEPCGEVVRRAGFEPCGIESVEYRAGGGAFEQAIVVALGFFADRFLGPDGEAGQQGREEEGWKQRQGREEALHGDGTLGKW